MFQGSVRSRTFGSLVCWLAFGLSATSAVADDDIVFEEVGVGLGVAYERTPSTTFDIVQEFRDESLTTPKTMGDVPLQPVKPRGAPGVALVDYDGDGDLDVYVTNGPGSENSLLSNQLAESGSLGFVDVAGVAGVAAPDQDSTGVCFGDMDNDGDPDLYVLGRDEENRLFENQGDGSFLDITASAGVGGGALGSASCAFGDVNGDGLLDLFVANVTEFTTLLAILVEPFALNQPNQLFLGGAGNTFTDVSLTSGIRTLAGVPADTHDITWAVTMVDYDQDGDTDILTASDNGGIPFAADGGVDRGFLRTFENDGTGSFTDVSDSAGLLASPGDWMGIAVADIDHNGTLDAFVTNTGDYFEAFLGVPGSGLGAQTTRPFLQNPDGTWTDVPVDPDLASVFGWGTAAFDYDNDTDTDLVYVGGLDVALFVEASNPGVVLANDGAANFSYDEAALAPPVAADHARRIDHGLAAGDLNEDGFVDFVAVSNQNAPEPTPFVLYQDVMPIPFTSPFNSLAGFIPIFAETAMGSGQFVWTGLETTNGTVAIELNSASNDHRSVGVRTFGTIGVTSGGVVNRDGIGAVVSFDPRHGSTATLPVAGGSSYASQNSLELTFGLGRAARGSVEVLWPGGVRNRLYNVRQSERILFPEIPCSFAGELDFWGYLSCVGTAVDELEDAGVLNKRQATRFFVSALLAYLDEL